MLSADELNGQEAGTADGRTEVVRRTWLTERNTLRLVAIAGLIAFWEVLSQFESPLFLPSPQSVGSALVSQFGSGGLLGATWSSFVVFALGFLIASAIGVPLGFAAARARVLSHLSDPLLTIFWATPAVALLPLIVIWFGLTEQTQVIIVFLSTFFPVVMETQTGVEHVDRTLARMATVFGANRRERFQRVLLPAALPYIVTGLRVGVGRAVIGVIVAELFVSANGLGAKMTTYANYFRTADYFAALIVFILFSLIVTELISVLERRASRWRVDDQ